MIAEFIQYTQVADQKIMDVFNESGKKMPEAERLFSHVLNAQHIWAKRILCESTQYGVWEEHHKEDFQAIATENFRLLQNALGSVQMEDVIVYKNSSGQEFTNLVGDMILHMLNHSTYHRGQIMTMFKHNGIEPLVTDYIILKRNHLL